MPAITPLGLLRVDSLHYYVRDLDRMCAFLTQRLDFAEIGGSSKALEESGGQRSAVFQAGDVRLIVSEPITDTCRVARWLRKHPEGVGTINFAVRDADHTFALLDQRGGTFLHDVQEHPTHDGGAIRMFSITTPFGDATFRFFEQRDTNAPYPGFEPFDTPRGGSNRFGFERIDHITSNFQTMRPMLLWMEHVMGFEVYWDVAFHTADIDPARTSGSGLKSVVVWDPESQVKFANNEPARPFFKSSQINVFNEDLRGDGIQHAALSVGDIIPAVRGLRKAGVEFMPTPGTYYDMLPERIQQLGINRIDEDIEVLRELEILVDGEGDEKYMLQIFLKEQAGLFDDPDAGPFFIEVIQRKGDKGFGAGNFRALFESIERQQRSEGRI